MFIERRHVLVTKAPEGRHVFASEYGLDGFNARTQIKNQGR